MDSTVIPNPDGMAIKDVIVSISETSFCRDFKSLFCHDVTTLGNAHLDNILVTDGTKLNIVMAKPVYEPYINPDILSVSTLYLDSNTSFGIFSINLIIVAKSIKVVKLVTNEPIAMGIIMEKISFNRVFFSLLEMLKDLTLYLYLKGSNSINTSNPRPVDRLIPRIALADAKEYTSVLGKYLVKIS